MGQCEFNSAVCTHTGGNSDSLGQDFLIKKVGRDDVALTMSGSYVATKDQCSWVVKVQCGAPGLKIESTTTVDATKATLSFVEYSTEFNTLDKITLEDDVWLPSGQVPAYYDMSTYGGTGPSLKMQQFGADGAAITGLFQYIPG